MKYIFALILTAVSASAALPKEKVDKIVAAIYRCEGGERARVPYGILSIKVNSKEEARQACERTVINNFKRWEDAGCQGKFLDRLADVYCPKSCDAKGNAAWKKNVKLISKLNF
jgi:hypothetical protein